jgi:copper resistance protein D
MPALAMRPEWPAALLAWPAILGQELIFGSATLCVMLRLSADIGEAASLSLERMLRGWWRMFAPIIALMMVLMFVNQVAGMAGVSWRGALPLLGEVLAKTHSGHTWEWRLPVAAALPIAAWIPLGDRARTLTLAIICGALMAQGCILSHAIDFGRLVIAVRFTHMLAAGTWIGALFGYWVLAQSPDASSRTQSEAARVLSTLASWSVAILIATGIYLAYQGLGHRLNHLIYSLYGRELLLKLAGFSLVLGVGAYNRFWLVPAIEQPSARRAFLRTVSAETLMLLGVIGLSTLLAATPPARMSFSMIDVRDARANHKVTREAGTRIAEKTPKAMDEERWTLNSLKAHEVSNFPPR